MATTKISALPAATTADAADLTIVVTDIGAGALQDQKATVTQAATYSRALTGATTASAIVGSGSSLIINTALADSDTRIASTTSATLFFVDAGLDKVGIATAVPTQKLDVTGTVNATLFAGSGASLTGLGATSTAFRTVATDPSPLVAGDVWYNSTSDAFKCAKIPATAVFTASATLPVARAGATAAGTVSAAILFGGLGAGSSDTYTWNGTAWSTGGTLLAVFVLGRGTGTSTAALTAAGLDSPQTAIVIPSAAKYNGTSWTSTGSLITGRYYPGAFGTQSSSVVFSGGTLAGYTNTSEAFNGSTWSSGGNYPQTSQAYLSGAGGSSSSGVSVSMSSSNLVRNTYNGTSWASAGSVSAGRGDAATAGTQTSAIGAGGYSGPGDPSVSTSDTYNGASWSVGPSLLAARQGAGGCGASSTSMLVMGGSDPSSTELLGLGAAPHTFTVA